MPRWKIPASTLFILSCLFFIVLLIVVLPDVDLSDTAFHRGTAPLVVHALGTTAPPVVAVTAPFRLPSSKLMLALLRDSDEVGDHLSPNFLPIFLRSLRR